MMMPPPVSTHAGRLSLGPQPACAGRLLVRLLAVRPVCIVARVERRQDQGGSAGHLLVRSKKQGMGARRVLYSGRHHPPSVLMLAA